MGIRIRSIDRSTVVTVMCVLKYEKKGELY